MKFLLLSALVSLQLLAFTRADPNTEEHGIYRRSVNPFTRPPPPPRKPIITDDLRGVNPRFARSTNDDDFQAFFDREVSSIIQDEIHKAIEEVMNDNGHSHDEEEHERHRRSVNPFARPPPPRRPIVTDDIRGGNRRWARDTHLDEQIEPELLRERRDLQIPGYKKPTHHNVIIPNWNPNARTQPWQTIGVRRHTRDLQEEQEQLNIEELNGDLTEFEEHSRLARGLSQDNGGRGVLINRPRVPHPDSVPRWRNRRDLQIPGYKKPTHSTVIIPNWNPNVRTQPWQRMSIRNRRSYDSKSHASRGTSSSSSSHDTGRTHPGYNRRNA